MGTANQPQGMPQSRLRIGLLVNDVKASKYVYEFVQWAEKQPDLAITHLIVHEPTETRNTAGPKSFLVRAYSALRRDGLHRILSKLLFQFIVAVEKVMLSRQSRYRDHFDSFDLSKLVRNHVHISPIVSKSGFVLRFSEADINKLKNLELDVLIRCGWRILRGDILRASRLGVISFHHADNRINRGAPAGFWEVYLRQDTTGFIIQRLTEELDGGDVLLRGHFQTRHYYLLNQASLFTRSNHYLMMLMKKIATTGELPAFLPSFPYAHELFRAPNVSQATVYLGKLLAVLARRAYRKLMGIDYRWHVAVTRGNWRNAVLWRHTRLEAPRSHYLADPFLVTKDDKTFCFVEDFDIGAQIGSIAVYEITNNGSNRLGTALQEPFHLSFPYIFEYRDELYMCPETSAAREIRVYRCIEFPLRWTLEKVLMRDVSTADTMLFEKHGKWWMLTNNDPVEDGDHCSVLSIFSAESPLAEYWAPHPHNPVLLDAGRARNAGLIREGNSYFRLSQAQGLDLYGKNVLINEIVELSEDAYTEVTQSIVTPNFTRDAVATHHLNSNDNYTVFDFATIDSMRNG